MDLYQNLVWTGAGIGALYGIRAYTTSKEPTVITPFHDLCGYIGEYSLRGALFAGTLPVSLLVAALCTKHSDQDKDDNDH